MISEEVAREILREAMSIWWLRPENGLALACYVIYGADFNDLRGDRSADYACGDGVNTFFKCGGRFEAEFDLFNVAKASASDVVASKIDVFDYVDQEYRPSVKLRPKEKWSFGLDHKQALLDKSKRLDLYDSLVLADLRDNATAVEDGSLDLAYCNSLYWVQDSRTAATHIVRKVKSGGYAVFDVMTAGRQKLNYQHMFPALPKLWQDLMNRGRDINNPGIKTERGWTEIFSSLGTLEEIRAILPMPVAIAWNIGLRPIFPMLHRMAQELTTETRMEIKREWVDLMVEATLPLAIEPQEFGAATLRPRLQYLIRVK